MLAIILPSGSPPSAQFLQLLPLAACLPNIARLPIGWPCCSPSSPQCPSPRSIFHFFCPMPRACLTLKL